MLGCRSRRLLKGLSSSSISNGTWSHHHHHLKYFSISSSNPKPTHFMVDFLINSLGFTKEAAITTSSKVPSLKSTKKPQLVINNLKQLNLDNTHIKDIIFYAPKILNCIPNKTLEPKIRFFLECGFSGSDIVELMKGDPYICNIGLHTRIVPIVGLIRGLVTSDEKAVEAIKKTKWLFSKYGNTNNLNNVSANVMELQVRGLSNDNILKLVTKCHSSVVLSPSIFKRRLVRIVQELGIRENSPTFFYAVSTIYWHKRSDVEKKFRLIRSYGWSQEQIVTFTRFFPLFLGYSENKIRSWLDFFMHQLGYSPAYLVTRTFLLTLSLEKRVKPRYKVYEMLKEKKLVSTSPDFTSLVLYPEPKFLNYVKCFENELPGLVETYTNSIKKTVSCKGENCKL